MINVGYSVPFRHDILKDLVIPKPAPPAFVFRNWETKFKFFDTFDMGFSTAGKLFAMGQLLKVVHGGKEFSKC